MSALRWLLKQERGPVGRGLTLTKSLFFRPPILPMEAFSVDEVPEGAEWQYEPKWDGFRCLVFRNNKSVNLQSKSGQPLTRYFPELEAAVASIKAKRFVLDGEIVVPRDKGFSFDDLLQRIHPAASRIRLLAAQTPAMLVLFDLLLSEKGPLIGEPLSVRRRELARFAREYLRWQKTIRISKVTANIDEAKEWLRRAGSGFDGIVAKRRDLSYQSGNRKGMQKIKNFRSADCVVGGFRYNEGTRVVGSLLLGLYDHEGLLNHVGFTSSLKSEVKKPLTAKLRKLISPPGFTGAKPGGPSRWSTKRSTEWEPLKSRLVVEVCYDHFTGGRFRHGTRLLRWRPDKSPKQCTIDQVEGQKTLKLSNFLE